MPVFVLLFLNAEELYLGNQQYFAKICQSSINTSNVEGIAAINIFARTSKLKRVREQKKVSQSNLTGMTNINRSHLAEIEVLMVKPVPFELQRIANALNVTVEDIEESKSDRLYLHHATNR